MAAMSDSTSRPGRRRTGGPRYTDFQLSVGLGPDLGARIGAAAERYNVSKGIVVRYALAAGMRAALQRLQREVPPDQRSSRPEADG